MARQKKAKDHGAGLGFEEKLWLAADKLRGHMDAAEYKHVVLGLVFLKYISDAFQEHFDKLAVKEIGPPSEEDSGCMATALASKGKFGRLHALEYYSNFEKANREQLRLIATLVSDSDAGMRSTALKAIAFVGPTAKREVFPVVLRASVDPDASIAAQGKAILDGFSPLDDDDREHLVSRLTDVLPKLRLRAIESLMPFAADSASALQWFGPRLGDASAEVRVAALDALVRWGPKVKSLQPRVVELTADPDESVCISSVRLLGEMGNGTGVVLALGNRLSSHSSGKVREEAARSILKIELNDARTDVPVLLELLMSGEPRIQAGALEKLSRFAPAARDALPAILNCAASSDPAVLYWSLRAAAGFGAEAAAIVPRAHDVLIGKAGLRPVHEGDQGAVTIDGVRIQAAETISSVAPKPVELLLNSLDEPLPAPVAAKMCEVIGKRVKEVPASAVPRFFLMAEKQAELRPSLSTIVGGMGGDEIFKKLAERTYWSFKTLGNGKKVKECKYPLEVQVWAIRTMGLLDPRSLSEAERATLLERMTSIPKTNPDVACREEAQAAYIKLVAAGLASKKP